MQKSKTRKPRYLFRANLILIIYLGVFLFNTGNIFSQTTSVPHLLNYQGRLINENGMPVEGNRSIVFKLYSYDFGTEQYVEEWKT